jgi:hypothetical protein
MWNSKLVTGWMIAGQAWLSCSCENCTCVALMNGVNAELFKPLDFIRAEALGMDTPARCAEYRNCRECKFWADSITFKENKEYEFILNWLHLDEGKKKWTAS